MFCLPLSVILAAVIWMIGDLLRVFAPVNTNVGSIAHLAGLGIGILSGVFLLGKVKNNIQKSKKVRISEPYIRKWEDIYMKQ